MNGLVQLPKGQRWVSEMRNESLTSLSQGVSDQSCFPFHAALPQYIIFFLLGKQLDMGSVPRCRSPFATTFSTMFWLGLYYSDYLVGNHSRTDSDLCLSSDFHLKQTSTELFAAASFPVGLAVCGRCRAVLHDCAVQLPRKDF